MPRKNFRSILITGASSGIGAALATTFAAAGVTLFLGGRDKERLAETGNRCSEKGAKVSTHAIDVTDCQGMEDWIAGADRETSLDLVVANAGLGGAESLAGKNGEDQNYIRQMIDVNIVGMLNTVAPLQQTFIDRQSGQFALVSSIAAYRGLPDSPGYCATKAAVKTYGEALRPLLMPHKVGVSVILPGYVESRMSDSLTIDKPFLMTSQRAATIIRKGLENNRAQIAFPWQMSFASRLGAALPLFLGDRILSRFRVS